MSVKGLFTILAAGLLLSGCAVLNPYEDSFQCPNTEDGLCVDLPTAYDIATGDVKVTEEEKGRKNIITFERTAGEETTSASETEYKASLYKELKGLLDQPATPMIKPPKIMRVLIMPYKDTTGALMMSRHIYLMLDEPTWVVGDYLNKFDQGM